MAPTGPIRAREPNGGSFGITWETLNRWDDAIARAAREFGAANGIPDLAPNVLERVMNSGSRS